MSDELIKCANCDALITLPYTTLQNDTRFLLPGLHIATGRFNCSADNGDFLVGEDGFVMKGSTGEE